MIICYSRLPFNAISTATIAPYIYITRQQYLLIYGRLRLHENLFSALHIRAIITSILVFIIFATLIHAACHFYFLMS